MPPLYQAQCRLCGYESPVFSGGYHAILVDDPTVAVGDRHPEDHRLVILAHPAEMFILEECGFTYESAAFSGRLLHYGEHVCKSCGHYYESRRLAVGAFALGCLPPLMLAIINGSLVGYWRSSIALGCLIGWLTFCLGWVLIDWLADVYVQIRFADRAREVRIDRRCPKCKSRRIAHSGPVPCPKCHQASLEIQGVGFS